MMKKILVLIGVLALVLLTINAASAYTISYRGWGPYNTAIVNGDQYSARAYTSPQRAYFGGFARDGSWGYQSGFQNSARGWSMTHASMNQGSWGVSTARTPLGTYSGSGFVGGNPGVYSTFGPHRGAWRSSTYGATAPYSTRAYPYAYNYRPQMSTIVSSGRRY